MGDPVRAPEDYDLGFVCKACGSWFNHEDTKEWDTKWSEPDAEGERWPLELIFRCPLCGEVRSYVPNETVLRGIWLGKP
ncbi:MAG TPA: hypothetical protein VGE89_06795 [Bryobacteraceae bacterium]|jgi:transcription initiation factor IIE alpha subunit